jgi:saccharopine dehydrogenase-like NADP-dependent oxidoreductase
MKIVLLGAGKSAGFLIEYTCNWTFSAGIEFVIADQQVEHLTRLKERFTNLTTIESNLGDAAQRSELINKAFLVISMLPAFMHPEVAAQCIESGAHLVTASYESEQIKAMKQAVEQRGLIFINECGLDPGLDHMSAMRVIHEAQEEGKSVEAFYSYCGGLVSPECVGDNPWAYKFSWNPRNVIVAGQGTARYLEDDKLRFLPYHRLFSNSRTIEIDGKHYDGYPNRDSIAYREVYSLNSIKTMLRGTLRNAGFCKAWDVFVQLGLTDDTYLFPLNEHTTYRDFLSAFLPMDKTTLEENLKTCCGNDAHTLSMILWTGIASENKIGIKEGSPAKILQTLLEDKWKLQPDDRDLVVMQHIFKLKQGEETQTVKSSLYLEGEPNSKTAMAKTVGIPLAIAARLISERKFNTPGIHIPILPELYNPILDEIGQNYGIQFKEETF